MKKYTYIHLIIVLLITTSAYSQNIITDNIGSSYQYLESQTTNPLGPQNTIADLTEKFWLSNEGGAVPIDIYYHEATNRVFVYGKRNIAVYDASSGINSLITRLPLIYFNDEPKEEPSQFYPAIEQTNYLNTNHFAFKPGGANPDILYCLGEAFNVYEIDPVNLTVDFKYRASAQCDQLSYDNAFIKYDPRLDWIYVIFSTISDGYVEINDVSNSYSAKGSLHYNSEIRSFEFNHNTDEYYLGLGNSFQSILFDPTEFYITNGDTQMIPIVENTTSLSGDMLYINEAGMHKLFCFPNGSSGNQNFYVKDFSSGTVTPQQCPANVTSVCYNGSDKVYLSYKSAPGNTDLRTICPSNYSTIGYDIDTRSQSFAGNNYTLDMEMLDGNLILTKDSEIVLYNTANSGITQLYSGENNYFNRVVENNNKAYAIGIWSTNLIDFSADGTLANITELGGIVFKACHNIARNKIYFYNTHIQDKSKVYIFDTQTNNISILELNGAIADIEIHPLTNNALISGGDGAGIIIKVVDGNTNVLLPENDWLELEPNHSNIGEMYVSPNHHLYCIIRDNSSGNPGIEIRDISQSGNTLYAFIQYNTTNTISGVFTSSNSSQRAEDDYVYAAINNPNESSGRLYKINDETYDYGSEEVASIPVNSFDIEKEGKFIYIAISSTTKKVLAIDDTSWPNPITTELIFNGNVKDIDVNETNGYLYVLHNNDNEVGETAISTVSGTSVNHNKLTALYKPASNIKYNADNNCLYVFVHYVPNGCITDPGGIYEIFNEDMGEDGFVFYANTDRQRDKNGMSYMPFPHDMVLDQSSHTMYYGGGGHSCINKLELVHTYKIKLRLATGSEVPDTVHTTWLSIPRHYHSIPANPPAIPTDAEHTLVVLTQNTIDAEYSDLTLQHIQIQGIPGNYLENDENAHWINNNWVYSPQTNNDMDKIYSYRGYKLHLKPDWAGNNYLNLYGSIEDPNTSFDLKCREQNWIGYFIPEVQDVFDALGDNLNHIYMIQHQDFTCVKTPYPSLPCPGTHKSGNDIQPGSWSCDRRHNIKFGDMIIVWPDTDIDGAIWNWTGSPPSNYTRPDVEYYEPDVKADYTTMSIELDSTNNPQEIGAFVNDSCVGACSVLSEDTLVVMKAYLDGQPGDSVVFREHYASREINERVVKDYLVLNLENMQKEKRAIVVGEGNPLIVVSFKKGSANEEKPLDIETNFIVYPNPASHEVNFSLSIDRETMLIISIYSINGRLVSKPVEQMVEPGLIDSALKLTDGLGNRLKPGIYVIRAEIGEITEIRKLIVE